MLHLSEYSRMGEFLEVVQIQEAVKGLLNFLKFS